MTLNDNLQSFMYSVNHGVNTKCWITCGICFGGTVLSCVTRSPNQHERFRCDMTMGNSMVTLKALSPIFGTIFKKHFVNFAPLMPRHDIFPSLKDNIMFVQ